MSVACRCPELLERLRARLRAGDSWLEAAAALGISKGAVSGLIRRHGMGDGTPPPPPPKAPRHTPAEGRPLLEAIRLHLRRGLTVREASLAAGTTVDVGRGLIRRHGTGPMPPKPEPEPLVMGSPAPGCCAWPSGNGPYTFECRSPAQPGRSYCAHHHKVAFIRVREPTGAPFILPVRAA